MRPLSLTPHGPSLGGATPLVCVPIVAADASEALHQAQQICTHQPAPDVVELRADALPPPSIVGIPQLLQQLHTILGDIPILFTHRRVEEGGLGRWAEDERIASILSAIHSGHVALADIELATATPLRERIITASKAAEIGIVVSAHDFTATPDDAALAAIFAALIASGGDAAKYAATPTTPADALRLLRVTAQVATVAAIPLISMAMGAAGTITRLAGPFFGSALTFATIGATSAPGQMPIALVRDYWRHAGLRD